ncbi:hypothetical protein ACFOJE_19420 [Azotobacter bryophylli]|uniref:Relaxasome subunit MobC n=1 Tax=Azotobacter bryophylli TaxID=1986537 RepID=A0ABV7AYW2_9GAMM
MSESQAERIRRQNKDRQQAKRDREREHRKAVGAETFKMEMYAGTRRDLECIQQVGGYMEIEEGLTLAVRYMAGLARRDPEAFRQAMDPRRPL